MPTINVNQTNASETAKGIVEEATQAQVNAGTDTGETGARLFAVPSKIIAYVASVLSSYLTSVAAALTYTPLTRTISTTSPLSGGGDLSEDRTLTTSMNTNKLIGRGSGGIGVMEEITLGTGLSLTGTTLNGSAATSPGGSNTNIQFNDSSAFGGNSGFTYQKDFKAVNLTQEQMIKNMGKCYMMAYNGRNASEDQKIGIAYSIDGITFFKSKANPVLTVGAGGTFDDVHLAHPHLMKVNDTYYIYYSAYDGTNYTIGLATSRDAVNWTKYGQVLTIGAGGTWDDVHVFFPEVIYDEDEADATRRWKMWYTGSADGSTYQIGYAYSSNGLIWTKYASNPVLTKGGVGTWDEDGVISPHVQKVNSTYYLVYEGTPSGAATSSIGVATFANPESSYTKDAGNPMIINRGSATAALTANTLTSSKTVTVANTALFNVNEYVFMDDGNSTEQINRIVSIDSGTQLTMRDAAASDFTTAQSAFVRSIYYAKITPAAVVVEDGRLRIFITAYRALTGLQRELSASLTATTFTTGWAYDYNYGIVLSCFGSNSDSISTDWDYISAENPSVIINGLDEVFYAMRYAAYINLANTFTAANTFSSNLRTNGVLTVNTAPATWSGVSAQQTGTDVTLFDFGNGLGNLASNIRWDGSNYKYLNTRGVASINIGHSVAGVASSIGFATAASGPSGNTATVVSYAGLTNTGNFVLGANTNTMTIGTSAVGVFYQQNATAPGSSPTDQFAMYAADQTAGNSCPHFRTENGNVIKLFKGSTFTQTYSTASTTVAANTGIDNAQVGNVYASVADLNAVTQNVNAIIDLLQLNGQAG